MPSPPGYAPAPPLPRRSVNRRTRSGSARSSASTGVSRVFVIAVCTPLMPVPPGSAALPAADGLVVHPARVAEQHVVHRPLPGRADPPGHGLGQRAEAHVGHPLAHLDVAGADRGRGLGGDDRAGRRDHDDRAHRAAVRRDGRVGRAPQRERDRAHRHRLDRVHVAGPLRVGAGEVERRARSPSMVTVTTTRYRHAAAPAGDRRESSDVGRSGTTPSGSARERGAHAPLAVVDDLVRADVAPPSRVDELAEPATPTALAPTCASRSPAPLVGRAGARRRSPRATASSTTAAGRAGPPRRSRARRAASSRARCRRRRRGGRGWRPSRPARRRRTRARRG